MHITIAEARRASAISDLLYAWRDILSPRALRDEELRILTLFWTPRCLIRFAHGG